MKYFDKNGKKIFDSIKNKKNVAKINFIELDLKKGENVLQFKIATRWAKSPCAMIFSPYADPALHLSAMVRKDFETAKASQNWEPATSHHIVQAMFSAKDNSRFFKKSLINMIFYVSIRFRK